MLSDSNFKGGIVTKIILEISPLHMVPDPYIVERRLQDVFMNPNGKKSITAFLDEDLKRLYEMAKSNQNSKSGIFTNANNMETFHKRGRPRCRYESGCVTKFHDDSLSSLAGKFSLKVMKKKFVLHGSFLKVLAGDIRLKCAFEDGVQKGEISLFKDGDSSKPFLVVDDAIDFQLKSTTVSLNVKESPSSYDELRRVQSKSFLAQNNRLSCSGKRHDFRVLVKGLEPSVPIVLHSDYESENGRSKETEKTEAIDMAVKVLNALNIEQYDLDIQWE